MAKGNNSGNVVIKLIGPKDNSQREKVLCMAFHDYRKKNHSNMAVSNASKYICPLYHVFANRHKFKITNSDFCLTESDENNNVERQSKNTMKADDGHANSFDRQMILMMLSLPK